MEIESHASNIFDFAKCRAKIIIGANNLVVSNLVDCLSPEQAHLCGCSFQFGNGYFCKHLRRDEIIENTEKLQSESNSQSGVSQSDTQE